MRVAIAGASGLIGTQLASALDRAGHEAVAMVRSESSADDASIRWNPATGELDVSRLRGIDAIVNLAGRGVADSRWAKSQKHEILASRVDGNTLLAEAINGLEDGPRTFVAGSAIGFYGDTGSTAARETDPPADDFLASVCVALEEAAGIACSSGCRVVLARTGIVLSEAGGALGEILPFFKLGLGGRIGRGDQWWSWISIHDEVSALMHLLESDLSGAVNLVAPEAVTNAEFTKTLGGVLHRPTFLPTPKPALWARLGRELTEALLYTSTRVTPERLLADGFEFAHPTLQPALADMLAK